MKNKLLAILIFFLAGLFIIFYAGKIFNLEKDKKNNKNNSGIIEKQIYLKQIKNENSSGKTETPQEKINEIKEKSLHYKTIKLNSKNFYFDIIGENLRLNLENKFIGNFPVSLKNDIKLQKIYGNENKYFLSLENNKYIFEKNGKILTNFQFKIPIKYIKEDEYFYIISSEKGIFLYDKKSKKIDYSYIFSDFIIYKNSYIAIVQINDKKRTKKFNLNFKEKNIIFYYNPKTKEQKILFETNLDLEKIYLKNSKIFFEDKNQKNYELENL